MLLCTPSISSCGIVRVDRVYRAFCFNLKKEIDGPQRQRLPIEFV